MKRAYEIEFDPKKMRLPKSVLNIETMALDTDALGEFHLRKGWDHFYAMQEAEEDRIDWDDEKFDEKMETIADKYSPMRRFYGDLLDAAGIAGGNKAKGWRSNEIPLPASVSTNHSGKSVLIAVTVVFFGILLLLALL